MRRDRILAGGVLLLLAIPLCGTRPLPQGTEVSATGGFGHYEYVAGPGGACASGPIVRHRVAHVDGALSVRHRFASGLRFATDLGASHHESERSEVVGWVGDENSMGSETG